MSSRRARHVLVFVVLCLCFFFFKQKTAYEMRISDWSSDVCSSDLLDRRDLISHLTQRRDQPFQMGAVPGLAFHVEAQALGRQIGEDPLEIGRASCRERVCQYV